MLPSGNFGLQGDIYFNYGCLPRTWEDPAFIHPDLSNEGSMNAQHDSRITIHFEVDPQKSY